MNEDLIINGVEQVFGKGVTPLNKSYSGGGCINTSYIMELTNGEKIFIKENQASLSGLFAAEKAGLEALKSTEGPRIPRVLYIGENDVRQLLILEYIPETGRKSSGFYEKFGQRMAKLHKEKIHDTCGFITDNHIGATPQQNPWTADWIDFFAESRLMPQTELAKKHGKGNRKMYEGLDKLIGKLSKLLVSESPCLIHGDLWGGNFLCGEGNEAVLIDPAVSYSHREADLAMTELFGGFSSSFYEAYNEEYPLSPGYRERVDIYNLYHLLNHLNLFGESYSSGIMQTLKKYGCAG